MEVIVPEIESWGYRGIAVVKSTSTISWLAVAVVTIKVTVPLNS